MICRASLAEKLSIAKLIILAKPTKKKDKRLLYYFSFLPAEIFAFAFSAFQRGSSVSCAAVSADFHVQPVLLRDGFFDWV